MRDGWQKVTVGDVASVDDGSPVESPWEHELLTVRLHSKGLVASGKRPNRTARGRKHFQRREGQILIGRQNYHRQCVGVVTPDLDGFVTSNAITALRPNELAALGFVELVMSTEHMAAEADNVMPGTGQREISQNALLSLPIVLPPLREQERIVDLIATLDTTIQKAEKEAEALQYLTEKLREKAPEAPEVRVGEVLSGIQSGVSTKPVDGDGPEQLMLSLAAIRPGRFRPEEVKSVGAANLPARARVSDGDLLITRSNTPERVGYVARARDVGPETYFPDLVWRLQPVRERVTPDYLEQILSSPTYRSRVAALATGTSSSMRKINKGNFSSLSIPLPTLDEQQEYVRPIGCAVDAGRWVDSTLTRLRALRANLLTMLLSGEHEIPESYDELTEEAS